MMDKGFFLFLGVGLSPYILGVYLLWGILPGIGFTVVVFCIFIVGYRDVAPEKNVQWEDGFSF